MSVMLASYPPEPSAGEEMLRALREVSVAGVARYQPLRNAAGDIVEYLNPAAQRLLGLAMQPAITYCQQFPDSVHNGSMNFQRAASLTGEAGCCPNSALRPFPPCWPVSTKPATR